MKTKIKNAIITTIGETSNENRQSRFFGALIGRLVNSLIFYGVGVSTPRGASDAGLSLKEWEMVFSCNLSENDNAFFMGALLPDDMI
jgi:hypothetical protein